MSLLTTSCRECTEPGAGPLAIDNALTAAQIAAARLTPEVMWKMGRVGDFALSPDGTRVVYSRTDYNVGENRGVTTLWLQSVEGGEPKKLTGDGTPGSLAPEPKKLTDNAANASSPVWSDNGSTIFFLSDRGGSNQLWSIAADGGKPTQITDSQTDIEHFGVAPKSGKIYLTQRVKVEQKSAKEIYPDLDKAAARVHDDLMVRHWDRWTDGSHLHIFVADFDGTSVQNAIDIMPDEPWDAPMEPYFDGAEIAWNHAGTQLAYTCKKVTGTEYAISTDSDIYLYDVASGETTNICKPIGTSLENYAVLPGYDRYPRFSPDDSRIAFSSMERGGFEADRERIFVYQIGTRAFSEITRGFDHSATSIAWNADGQGLTFLSYWFGTEQMFAIDMEGTITQITDGEHDITAFSRAGGRTVVALARQDRAPELFTLNGAALTPLTDINGAIFGAIETGRVERRTIRTTDGKDMLTWVIYPPDFDPAKKYPTLLYCEGGPQSAVSQGWSYRWNFQLMAAQGYIVVAPNRRGTFGFGQAWTDQISGDYSGQNIRDYLSAIDEMAREPYVDADRLGCVGASYGGYSAFYLAGVHQNRFKAFIAHCGIFNLESMYGHTEELFFVNHDYGGPYWSDRDIARRTYAASPHRLVKNWNTPILIITGENDFRIPYTQSIEAHTAARLLGVPARLVSFENEAHQVFRPQNNLAWNREFFGWLDKYVKGDE